MPVFPLVQGSYGFGQTFAGASYGSTLTGNAAANVMGAAVQLIASTTHDAHWIEVSVGAPSGSLSYAVDILIGAATEEILIPKLTFWGRAISDGGGRWLFPIFIPNGSRISARVQASAGSATCLVAVNLFNSGLGANTMPSNAIQYGTIATSLGQNLDPGGVANTDVTIEMTASTTRDHRWMVLTVVANDSATAVTTWLLDVCIGSATEQEIVSDILVKAGSAADIITTDRVYHMPIFVPRGSRLTVRGRSSSIIDGDRDLFVTLHGA